jgi:hypothetical protein
LSRILGFFSEKTTDTGTDLTSKGDIHGYSDTNTRVPIGSNDQILTADSSEALGLKWADSSGLSSPLTSNLVFNDNVLAAFGTGGTDSYVKHDGSNMYIKSTTGNAILQSKFQMEQNSCFAVNIAIITISSGDITGTDNVMQVDTEGSASSDDLDHVVMNGSGQSGAYFTLKAYNDGRTVVVKDGISGTGELLANGDFSLDNGQDTITFGAFQGLTNNYEVSRSDNNS